MDEKPKKIKSYTLEYDAKLQAYVIHVLDTDLYLSPSEGDLKREMAKFTEWLDGQLENAKSYQTVDLKMSI